MMAELPFINIYEVEIKWNFKSKHVSFMTKNIKTHNFPPLFSTE